jgi:hypothetical protein
MDRVERFKSVAQEVCALYEKKDKCYGGSFNTTYDNLGVVSAATRISDKYNRLCNLVKNPNIDNLGESLTDTLMDLAAYSIMTIVKLNENEQQNQTKD